MVAAFSVWQNRIAPVFDVAKHLRIVKAEDGKIIKENKVELPTDTLMHRVDELLEWNIDLLVCGAISRPLYALIAAYGIDVVPFVAGEVDRIVEAWLSGEFDHKSYLMPGCWRRGKRLWFRGFRHLGKEEYVMQGRGQGGGTGRGRGSRGGRGRMGGPSGAGPGGSCVCPQCGYREPHKRGVPCINLKCPKCGTGLVRE